MKSARTPAYLSMLLALLLGAFFFIVVFSARAQPTSSANAHYEANYDLHVPLTPQERAYLDALPALKIGMDPDWAPYAFVNADGEMDGISADYLNYIVQTLHIKVQRVESTSWSDTIRLANAGRIDIIAAASHSSQIAAPFLSTRPYIDYPEVIVTRKNAQPIVSLYDLDGLSVAMVEGSASGEAPGLDTLVTFHRLTVNSAREGLQALADGKVQAYVGNLGVAQRLIHQYYAGVLHVSGATGYSRSLSFGVAPQYEQLCLLMDRVLKAIPEEDRERIQNTWLRTSLEYGIPRRTLWQVLTPIGAVILVSIAVLGFIIAFLRKEIRQRRWTEQELRFQIEFQQSLMTTAPIPIFIKDLHGRYLAVNPAFEHMAGLESQALIGKRASDVHPMHTASNDRLEALTEKALASGELVHGELQYQSNSGETHDVIYWLQLVHEEAKKPRALMGLLVDVSALRAMEREQRALKRQLMELTEVLPALLFQLRYARGEGFAPIFISNYAEKLTGYPQGALMASPAPWTASISPEARRSVLVALLHAHRAAGAIEQEFMLKREDGSSVWIRLEAVCHRNTDDGCIYTGYLSDVTQLKLQAESLARAIQEAEQASSIKDVFLATMSHEIRTPMSGVIGVLDLMNRSRLHADDQHLLDMARGAARTLLRVLNDVLDFSKSQSGHLTIEHQPFSLGTVIDQVMGLFQPETQRKGLRFDVFVSSLVAPGYIGDGQRLAQVLFNLVGNALKFTDTGVIGVVVEAQPIDPVAQTQSLSMTVRDTGIGIDEAGQARLFEPFVQVGTRHHGGTGLGLAICKRLISAMGGEIRLRSALGKGTSVDIVLALPVDPDAVHRSDTATAARAEPASTASAVPSSTTLQLAIPEGAILLVEDQPLNQELLMRQFQALGVYAFDTANNGLEAWQAYRKQAYALVLTDCAMPLMDGEELIRHIRASEVNTAHRACLVALTANATDQQRQACLEAGADDVMVKPVDLVQLRDLLTRVFSGAATVAPPQPVSPSKLPAGISEEEWSELRKQIAVDMERDLKTAQDHMVQRNWQQAWEATHRILGTARWFKLKEIIVLAAAAEEALHNERDDVAFEPLRAAIALLAEIA